MSYFAYWATQLALSLFANRLTRSPLLVSGVTFTLIIPWLVFGLFAGALVDRYDRRNMLLTIIALRLLTFSLAILAALSGYMSLPLLYGIALILGITQTLEEPALAAALPMLIPPAQLERANAWLAGAQNSIELLAFPLGALFASISVLLTMSVGAGCAAGALIALLFLRGSFHPTCMLNRHIMTEILGGVRFLWKQRVLWALALMAAAINACWEAYLAILVLYAVAPGPIGLSAAGYGILLMAVSVGGILGTLLTMPVQRWLGRRWAIGLNILGNSAMFAAPALTSNAWLIGGAALLGGMVGPMWTIAAASLLGRMVPARLQGRVNAAYRLLAVGSAASGPLLGGLIAQIFGLRVAFAVCAFLTALMLIPFFLVITEKAMNR
jgi:MFS family permease